MAEERVNTEKIQFKKKSIRNKRTPLTPESSNDEEEEDQNIRFYLNSVLIFKLFYYLT